MGNYISCTLTAPKGKHSNRAIKVVFPTGQIQQFYQPIKAAELMLETPNCFLVNSQSIQMGRRFSALSADEDLEMANVYLMFPMKRLNSVVTAGDMGALFIAANSVAKRRRSGGNFRILPDCSEDLDIVPAMTMNESSVPKLILDDIEEYSSPEFKHRLSMCRSKKPLLETIAEEPVCSR